MNLHENLRACFNSPLPGLTSHLEMAPYYRREEMQKLSHQPNAVKSSVLILFYLIEDIYHIVFIRRPRYDGVHSGQIALPGGRWESTDKSLYHTAIRESREEIGIDPSLVSYYGKLTDLYIPPSNYIVSPFVGIYKGTGHFIADPMEVAEIIEIPFSFFLDAKSVKKATIELTNGMIIDTPCFDYHGNIIWGATAMMVNELIILWKTTV
jgi:8-oxo-dGTP pyrophosphatase MutT (NUDIX family)